MDTFEILEGQLKKNNIKKSGVIHIGAHLGQEAEHYHAMGFKHVMWLEANPELCHALEANVKQYGHAVYNTLLSDKDKEMVDFYVTNNEGQSSSMLAPTDAYVKSGINVSNKFKLETFRFDSFCSRNNINLNNYNCLNIDVQGAELKVLKGFGALLSRFDFIVTEISFKRVYKGSVIFHELNNFLMENGFLNTSTSTLDYMGEAFYKKSNEKLTLSHKMISNLSTHVIERLVVMGIPQFLYKNQHGVLGSVAKSIYRKTVRKSS